MLRVRFHGRGGQGIKTASQILGTAAFLSGFQSQDFPLYGAERRGAPIVAFTRINKTPILERGPISIPDLLLIGDETLLEDSQAAPLCGSDEQTVVFVNSEKDSQVLKKDFNLKIPGQWFINPGPEVSCTLTFWAIRNLIPVFQKSHNGGAD